MLPYTPVPVRLPADFPQPQDAVDDVVVATVNPMVQTVADGVAYRELIGSTFGQWTVDGSNVASGSLLAINSSPVWGGTGFTTTATEIEVPEAGIYLCSFNSVISAGGASDPLVARLTFEAGLLGTFGPIWGVRWALAEKFSVTGAALVPITNVSTQKISIYNNSGVAVQPEPSYGLAALTIVRIN